MLKVYDVYYRVVIKDVCDPHFCPEPDTILPERYEDIEKAEAAVKNWKKEHPTAWATAHVRKYMDEILGLDK